MQTESLIRGLHDLKNGYLPAEAIYDMSEIIIEHLERLTTNQISVSQFGKSKVFIATNLLVPDYQKNNIIYTELKLRGLNPINPIPLIPSGFTKNQAKKLLLTLLINNCDSIAIEEKDLGLDEIHSQYLIASMLGYQIIKL